ncbi:hypothetical protein [Plantactinospora sp. BB1]|uniref:hypothetical protein n=1 Tax=Plantactinospora sp. BB1 TaxID=2071627 RepID=UPI000D15390D|nr:hypothetical protein [Plantactinospora sp. BB1]AVT37401.1 hypothetical protein C6W10_14035 [Plantactinospora sp. BB1]
MGASNVKLVYTLWRDLPDGPFRVLAYMALVSLDEDDPPKFWAGREALALATGRVVADRWTEDPDELAERRRAFKAVDRNLKALREFGAIWQIAAPHTGRQAVYGLHLKSTPLTGVQSGKSTPVNGVQSSGEHPAQWGAVALTESAVSDSGAESTPVSGSSAPRLAGQSTPVSGRVHPAQRGPEEPKKDPKKDQREEHPAAPLPDSELRKIFETPTSLPPVDAPPSGRRGLSRAEQSIAEASARRAARIVAEHTGATDAEAAAAVALIEQEKNPVSLVPFVQRLAADGDVAAYVDRARTDDSRQDVQPRAADAWWNN